MNYYIASCVFSTRFPKLSQIIQKYITVRFEMPIVRCCTPKYKENFFTKQMPLSMQDKWIALPDTASWEAGDVSYCLCHNCNNIIEEMHPDVKVRSLWELILEDEQFVYPDFSGRMMVVQDCWRSKDRKTEQLAVRAILGKMHIKLIEQEQNFAKTRFCGNSLYKAQPPRNPAFAPQHYKYNIDGLFIPHTQEQQEHLMRDYVAAFEGKEVLCYCHYCLEGLLMGGAHAYHLAQLLFAKEHMIV